MSIFRHKDKPEHCRIYTKHDKGQIKYYLMVDYSFDSLYSLITNYRSKDHPLHIKVNIQ